ncbi:MAG: isopentenyl-diphosphate Delta-isomerase [Mycobacteriaceae bacterium]
MDSEHVVLLDDERRPSGTMPKAEVHGKDTPLHLAFSVYVFDSEGRLLVTRRALSKHTWPGVWTNSCCGHVQPGEVPAQAARRRLVEELSVAASVLELALPDFAYRATSPEGIVENEVCPVFTTLIDQDPVCDPAEVAQWKWVRWSTFRELAASAPWAISPWAALQAPLLPATPTRVT